MKNIIESDLSIEEIYLIGQCTAGEKEEIINELSGYLDNLDAADQDMSELIKGSIEKVKELTCDELQMVLNYPLEND